MENELLALVILLPLLLGTTIVWPLAKLPRAVLALVSISISLSSFGLLLSQSATIFSGQTISQSWPWLSALQLNLSFQLDALSLTFGLIITGIGSLVLTYAYYYLNANNSLAKLYSFLMLFMAAMLGIALSNNLILFLVFWELTSLSSFLLISYWNQYDAAQRGARMSLLITGFGGLCLLAGFIILGHIAQTYEIDQIIALGSQLQQSEYFVPALLLILLGAFTKSAQFPFHFWLPNAMAAPTPVSAYLHSATMVKAGIFLLLRLLPIFIGSLWFHYITITIGLITFFIGAFFAVFKEDLKGLLAYSTISHLGLITCLIGIGSPLAVAAAVFHIINHALFKAALFMIAGIIDHETGTRNLKRLGGVWVALPITATLAIICAAAMGGVPLTNGFLSKEMFFHEVLHLSTGFVMLPVTLMLTLAAIFATAYSVRLVHNVFFSGRFRRSIPNQEAHDPSIGMLTPVVLLSIGCIIIGIAPALVAEQWVSLTAEASMNLPLAKPLGLAIWHGLNMALVMTFVAFGGGFYFYFKLAKNDIIREIDMDDYLGDKQGDLIFEKLLKSIHNFSLLIKTSTETGSLQQYLVWILSFAVVIAALPLIVMPVSTGSNPLTPASALAVIFWALLFTACWMMIWFHHERIKAVLISGAVGLVTTISFITLSAPDLALTQLSVDIVTTIILLMALSLLPQLTPYESSRSVRVRDATLAIIGGVSISWLAWLLLTRDPESISWFFIDQSYPLGGGTNVVNVILVDFRGFDTFGEITVLGIAALGVVALMDGMRMHGTTVTQGLSYRFVPSPLMLKMAASWILPIALLISLHIFLRGHNLPGGGFIAGLITSTALIMQYMALGQEQTEKILFKAKADQRYSEWIALGIGIAAFTGVLAWFWARPFLTSAHFYVHIPLIGDVHLASAILFDLGVYATVVGATMMLTSVLGDSRNLTLAGPVLKKERGDA